MRIMSFSSLRAYKEREVNQAPPIELDEAAMLLVQNAARMLKSLPNTPVRSAFLHELTLGLPCRHAATLLGMDPSNVSRASEYSDRPFVEFLRQLGFPRANREQSHQYLLDWLRDEKNCPFPSGSNCRAYFGSIDLMWAEYAGASLARAIPPLHMDVFERVRSREGVQLRSGDIFINRDEVELAELKAEIEAEPTTKEKHAKRVDELEKNLRFCKERKKLYRDAHQSLRGNAKKMIVTVDFTGTQTGMQDKFCNFVVVVCTDLPLQIPQQLANAVISGVEPDSLKKISKPQLEKRVRRTKLQVAQEGRGRKLLPSFAQDKAKMARERKLPQREVIGDEYKPSSTAFHFVLKRTKETPAKQTSPYVQWALDFLFQRHELANGFDEVHLFSDGCGKHFKTYPTHWYLADLQQHLREKKANRNSNNNMRNNSNNNRRSTSENREASPEHSFRIHWDFLPPGDAHNRCDAAAANWKRPQKKLIRDFCVLTTVGHLAFACSNLKNSYMIEAEYQQFPEPLDCLYEEPWMQSAFHFEYGVPFTAVKTCECRCKNKRSCLHRCCKQSPLLPCVSISIRDREGKYVFFFSSPI